MTHKTDILRRATLAVLAAALPGRLAFAQTPPPAAKVHVYLWHKVSIEQDVVTLGKIALVHSTDRPMVARLEALPITRSPGPGQSLKLVRANVLARLASAGVAKDRVRLGGATDITVTRLARTVTADQLKQIALAHVAALPDVKAGQVEYELIGTVRPLVLSAKARFQLQPRAVSSSGAPTLVLEIRAAGEDKTLGTARVLFRRLYRRKEAVAVKEVKAGEKITPKNTTIRTVKTPSPAYQPFHDPYGMIATYRVPAGAQVRSVRPDGDATTQPHKLKPTVEIKSGEKIFLRVRGPGFEVTALAEALESGRPGDFIRVRNIDTKRVVTGKIGPDGVVDPLAKPE